MFTAKSLRMDFFPATATNQDSISQFDGYVLSPKPISLEMAKTRAFHAVSKVVDKLSKEDKKNELTALYNLISKLNITLRNKYKNDEENQEKILEFFPTKQVLSIYIRNNICPNVELAENLLVLCSHKHETFDRISSHTRRARKIRELIKSKLVTKLSKNIGIRNCAPCAAEFALCVTHNKTISKNSIARKLSNQEPSKCIVSYNDKSYRPDLLRKNVGEKKEFIEDKIEEFFSTIKNNYQLHNKSLIIGGVAGTFSVNHAFNFYYDPNTGFGRLNDTKYGLVLLSKRAIKNYLRHYIAFDIYTLQEVNNFEADDPKATANRKIIETKEDDFIVV